MIQILNKTLKSKFGLETQKDSIGIDEFGEEGPVFDDAGDPIKVTTIEEFTSRDIIRYELKEDWFFDKQRSVLDVRIIGISPVVYSKNPETLEIDGLKIFSGYIFQNVDMFSKISLFSMDANDSQRMSFDDLFWKREFSSYIKKESNVYDRAISPNWDGLDALLESERIRTEMFTFEHDLWHF